jgi:hypothetical protein
VWQSTKKQDDQHDQQNSSHDIGFTFVREYVRRAIAKRRITARGLNDGNRYQGAAGGSLPVVFTSFSVVIVVVPVGVVIFVSCLIVDF